MSNKASTWVWHSTATENLAYRDLVVLLALADIANDEGEVLFAKRPSKPRDQMTIAELKLLGDQPALATKCRMSIPTFRRVLRLLETEGLLEVNRETATSWNTYRVVMTAQPDLWITDGTTAQPDRSHRSTRSLAPLTADRSHRSTVSDQRDIFNITTNPLNPAERGNRSPNPEVLARLGGRPLATRLTRECDVHERQRSTCVACWTVRPLSFDDVPWCGDDRACDKRTRLRPVGSAMTQCPACHPRAIDPAYAVQLLEQRERAAAR